MITMADRTVSPNRKQQYSPSQNACYTPIGPPKLTDRLRESTLAVVCSTAERTITQHPDRYKLAGTIGIAR